MGDGADVTWQRLRQRKLAQWLVGYAAGGWVTLQVAQSLAAIYDWPDAALRWLVAALLACFPAAMALAWYHGERGRQRIARTEVLVVGALLVIGGAVAWSVQPAATMPSAPQLPIRTRAVAAPVPAIGEKSVAVLPFENLSGDPENAYFVAGMQDLILTNLSKLGELKVISRASTEQYASRRVRLSQVGSELGVATVLEGSVQRVGKRVLINLQLVDARTEAHLWAETYRRDLADIFEVEEEIAANVAEALRARLTDEESASLAERPTRDPEALDWFLRAEQNHHAGARDLDASALAAAVPQYRRALARDPAFTRAWARLAICLSNLNFRGGGPGIDARQAAEQAREAVATALAQDPESPDAILASAWLRYRVDNDYAGAVKAFDAVLKRQPGNVAALAGRGTTLRRAGQPEAALADFDAALRLSPRDSKLVTDRASTLELLRRWSGAESELRRALTLDAANAYARTELGLLLLSRGDPDAALVVLQGDARRVVSSRAIALSYVGRFHEALELLRTTADAQDSASTRAQRALTEGLLHSAAGDAPAMRAALARADADHAAALRTLDRPQSIVGAWQGVATSAALQGQVARALDAVERAKKAAFGQGDAMVSLDTAVNAASVDLVLGRIDAAIPKLAALRKAPMASSQLSAAVLRLQPRLREARKDQRVQQEIRAWEAMEREAARRESALASLQAP